METSAVRNQLMTFSFSLARQTWWFHHWRCFECTSLCALHENPMTFPHCPVITMYNKLRSCLKSASNCDFTTQRATLRLLGNFFYLYFSRQYFFTCTMAARPHCHLHNKTRNKVSGELLGISFLRSIAILQGKQQISRAHLWRSYRGTAGCFSHHSALHSAQQASEQAGGKIMRTGMREK